MSWVGASAAATAHRSTSSVNASSPTTSIFSKGHISRGSGSSVASSPAQRDSLDMFAPPKRLEDVTEEPTERHELDGFTLVERTLDWSDYDTALSDDHSPLSPAAPTPVAWTLGGSDSCLVGFGIPEPKRRRSTEQSTGTSTHRFGGKFGSLSRRWKNRSAAGPQLSIITHHSTPATRSASLSSSQIISPALSAISRHESGLPASPTTILSADRLFVAEPLPMDIEEPHEGTGDDHEPGQATTPLLPPMLSEMFKKEECIRSPLQSPAIAPTSALRSSRTSMDAPFSHLPTPPLSTKPSMVSMHNRSRTNTLTSSPFGEIPPMQLLDESVDPWDGRLGHANFHIHPEPYVPDGIDLDSYTDYRKNWDQARANYARHITRTLEHYGGTSKVYKLTEEKWSLIEQVWTRQHDLMRTALAPVLTRLSDGESHHINSVTSSSVLEKPITRVVVPVINDKSGKFPELGDGEIVGPMSVARPRINTDVPPTRGSNSTPTSPHKRNLIKFLSDILRN
jgi:hypothetical protein